MATAKPTRAKKPRRRRDAGEARDAILDAAEQRLVQAGPAGIRLQEVAADVGVSHSTVLHHFGSREALVKAVIVRVFAGMHAGLVTAIEASTGETGQLAAMLDGVADALSSRGHGRALMWLALEGHRPDGIDVRLADVVQAAHAFRKRERKGKGKAPSYEDTAHTVVLASLALAASSVLGPGLLEQAGLEGSKKAESRFRAWLAKLLIDHFERDEVTSGV